MRVIITGGTGLIGRALVEQFAAREYEVIVVSRDPAWAARQFQRQPRVRAVGWDGCSAGNWGRLITAESAIVNLAGASPAHWRWTSRYKVRIRESRLRAIAAVSDAIARYGPPEALVQASASGYYGDRGQETLTEASAPGEGFRAEVCREVEEAITATPTRRIVLRAGIVLARDAGAFPPLLRFAQALGRQLGDGRQWIPWIHLQDVARAITFLIEQRTFSGPFNICAPDVATNHDFLRAARHILGRPGVFTLSAPLLRAALGEEASVALDSQRVRPQRLLVSGFTFDYPDLDQALRRLLS